MGYTESGRQADGRIVACTKCVSPGSLLSEEQIHKYTNAKIHKSTYRWMVGLCTKCVSPQSLLSEEQKHKYTNAQADGRIVACTKCVSPKSPL